MNKVLSIVICIVLVCSIFVGCSQEPAQEDIAEPAEVEQVENSPEEILEPTEPDEVTEEDSFDLDKYKELTLSFNDDVHELAITLGNMGTYETNFWEIREEMGGNVNYDTMVDATYEWVQKEADISKADIDASYDDLNKQYAEILSIEVKGYDGESIQEQLSSLHDSINSLHQLVLSPSGDLYSFANDLSQYLDDIDHYNQMLNIIITGSEKDYS